MKDFFRILCFISFLINLLRTEVVFIKLKLNDFDRTAEQVVNGENTRRSQINKTLLTFNYNLMKLADRELKRMQRANSILTPNLLVILNRKNIISKVDKYRSVVNISNTDFMKSRKCFDNYSNFLYKEWYSLTENCIPGDELDKANEYAFSRGFDSFNKDVFFIQMFAYDRPVQDELGNEQNDWLI